MIVSFRHKGLEEFYRHGSKRGLPAPQVAKLGRVLSALDVATTPRDVDLPGFRLHRLAGDRRGDWSIWVSANWRVTFRFIATDVELVGYEDYH